MSTREIIAYYEVSPVVVYPKEKIEEIARLIKESEADLAQQKAYDTVEDLFAGMGIDINSL